MADTSVPNPYVTLISSEGHRFILPFSAALGSGMIKDTLDSGFAESSTAIVELPEHRAEVVEKVAEYLMYKHKYQDSKDDPPDFQDRVKPEIALELLMASDFMQC